MWRFKASKYKNSAPKVPKKEEWISDINVGSSLQSQGNHVKASAMFMAFNIDTAGGGSLMVLPVDTRGRQSNSSALLHAHSDFVSDFDFSPFDDQRLATCSFDGTVKIWSIPEGGLTQPLSSAEHSVAREDKKVDVVKWHPAAENILAYSTQSNIKICDVGSGTQKYDIADHGDVVQSFGWNQEGSLLLSTCKDKKTRIIDPRAATVSQETAGHAGIKDSRAVWLKDTFTLTSGFDSTRQREVKVRDTRNFSKTLKTVCLDASTGILMPLFDADTNMLFLAGKGDTTVRFMELAEREPWLTDGSVDGVEQVRGAGLVPKRALDVMGCEVNRLLVLSSQALIPLPYIVPRKNVRDYNADLYPDTAGSQAAMTAEEWCNGLDKQVEKISLDPSKRKQGEPSPRRPTGGLTAQNPSSSSPATNGAASLHHVVNATPNIPASTESDATNISRPSHSASDSLEKLKLSSTQKEGNNDSARVTSPPKPPVTRDQKPKVLAGVYSSKYRHLEGIPGPRDSHVENIRNLSHVVPGESNMFHSNEHRFAVPLTGAGGLIAVIETASVGRLPDTGVPYLQNGSAVMDFEWDPFDKNVLAVGCDDAQVKIWRIPEGGLTEPLTEPEAKLKGHTEKLYFVRFHPLARDVLATASYDMTVRVWDVVEGEEWIQLSGHTDTIFDLAWSPDGVRCATVCKDGKIRLYDPRNALTPTVESAGLEGPRGARVTWVCNGSLLLVSGFSQSSCRCLYLYKSSDLSCVHKQELDYSPAILVPHYDPDSSVLLLTGRGESTVMTFEVVDAAPYLHQLTSHSAHGLHQSLSFLPKRCCDVTRVEFLSGFRLTNTSIEPLSFRVPRIKTEYFQDDIFKDTRVLWEPTMTSAEWLSGVDRAPATISLRPSNMKPLSSAPVEAPKPRKYDSYNPDTYKTDEQRKAELISAVSGKLEQHEEPLPQDLTEGVEDDEWDD